MKRDLSLMRQIMFDVENSSNGVLISELYPTKSVEEMDIVAEHLLLLADEGYIELGSCILGYGYPNYTVRRITNDGHKFLTMVRNDTTWNKILPKLLTAGGSVSLVVLEQIISKMFQ